MLFKVLISTLVICSSYFVNNASGTCGKCGDQSGAACVTPTSFYACINGTKSSVLQTCPGNLICANVQSVCVNASTSTQPPDCPFCGICNDDLRYACMNSTSFAYCFGTTTPSTMDIDSCPTGQYCSANAKLPNYCTQKLDEATCPPLTDITTTTTTTTSSTTSTSSTAAPPTTTAAPSAASICATRGVGRFTNPSDTTCRQFAHCFVYGGQIRSQFYKCMGQTVFSRSLQTCVVPSSTFSCYNS